MKALVLSLLLYTYISATNLERRRGGQPSPREAVTGPEHAYSDILIRKPSVLKPPSRTHWVKSTIKTIPTSKTDTSHSGTDDIWIIWCFAVCSAVLVGLSGVLPLLVITLESGEKLNKSKRLNFLLSFAVGSLLGDVFLHLLPEVWSQIAKRNEVTYVWCGLWTLVGMVTFFSLEKLFSEAIMEHNGESVTDGASCKAKIEQDERQSLPLLNYILVCVKDIWRGKGHFLSAKIHITGYLNLMANCIDNFCHGLAIGCSYTFNLRVGVLTTFAILIHEIPHEVGDFAILLKSGFSRWRAAQAQFVTASFGMTGALFALFVSSSASTDMIVSWILPFTSGGFLYIALVTVLPDLLRESCFWTSMQQFLCILSGLCTMYYVTCFVH